MTNIIDEINSLTLFSENEKDALASRIQTREIKGKHKIM